MNKLIDRLIGDDFLWTAMTSYLPGKRKRSGKGFVNINCPMCVRRGFTLDKRGRCGIKNDGVIGINCYNCGLRARWQPGELISRNIQEFLDALGMPEIEVKRLNLKALQYRQILEKSPEAMALIPEAMQPSFPTVDLPKGARRIDEWALEASPPADFIDVMGYLYSRGEDVAEAQTFYWTPSETDHFNRRIIIPFYFEGRIVGYAARAIDGGLTKYTGSTPTDFLFNAGVMSLPLRKYIILCEGVFDALAIDGVGMLGARLNAQQIAWIKSFGKTVIMVPDRDQRGSQMIDVAIENNWHVAFPKTYVAGLGIHQWWDDDIKDPADAVRRHGRVWTLLSIIESATRNKLAININRKMFA